MFSNGGPSCNTPWWAAESGCHGKGTLSAGALCAVLLEGVSSSDRAPLHLCVMTGKPGAPGPREACPSHPNHALPCRFSVTIQCLFPSGFVTWIVLPGRGQILFIFYFILFYSLRERNRKKQTGRKIIFSISSMLKCKDGSSNDRAPRKSNFHITPPKKNHSKSSHESLQDMGFGESGKRVTDL